MADEVKVKIGQVVLYTPVKNEFPTGDARFARIDRKSVV